MQKHSHPQTYGTRLVKRETTGEKTSEPRSFRHTPLVKFTTSHTHTLVSSRKKSGVQIPRDNLTRREYFSGRPGTFVCRANTEHPRVGYIPPRGHVSFASPSITCAPRPVHLVDAILLKGRTIQISARK